MSDKNVMNSINERDAALGELVVDNISELIAEVDETQREDIYDAVEIGDKTVYISYSNNDDGTSNIYVLDEILEGEGDEAYMTHDDDVRVQLGVINHLTDEFIVVYSDLNILNAVWDNFAKVPITDDDEIDLPFLDFEVGSNRSDIWEWFENQNSSFSCHMKIYGEAE